MPPKFHGAVEDFGAFFAPKLRSPPVFVVGGVQVLLVPPIRCEGTTTELTPELPPIQVPFGPQVVSQTTRGLEGLVALFTMMHGAEKRQK